MHPAVIHFPIIDLWPLFVLLIIVAAAAGFLQSSKMRGVAGERAVKRMLHRKLDASLYHCLHNVLIPNGRNGLTQIDHVVVSQWGIFVIETKNYSGWIFGTEHDKQWTVSYHGRRKEKLPNPLRQNFGHIRAVESLLKLAPGHCHGIVFFTGRAEFKKGPIPGVLTSGLAIHIMSFSTPAFDATTAADLAANLRAACQTRHPNARAAHLTQVRSRRSA
ncbi:MAG TPA: nuclease-related domain-containing protein [Verrucomicrobiales bacterium]|nr:nuclease-related domain-containing protein [Verrucomicrobiales bacterium]